MFCFAVNPEHGRAVIAPKAEYPSPPTRTSAIPRDAGLRYIVVGEDIIIVAYVGRRSTPWHLWAVALLGLLWNGFGVYNYLMTKLVGEPYLRPAGMSDAQLAYIAAVPAWTTAAWAIGVWGALLGSLLLLLRNRLAVPVFALSLTGFLAGLVNPYVLAENGRVMTEGATGLNLAIFAGCLFFLFCAWAMARRGILH